MGLHLLIFRQSSFEIPKAEKTADLRTVSVNKKFLFKCTYCHQGAVFNIWMR